MGAPAITSHLTSLISPSILILTEPASSKTRRAASRFDFRCSGVKNALSVDVNDTGSSVGRTASIAERERSFFFQSNAFSATRFFFPSRNFQRSANTLLRSCRAAHDAATASLAKVYVGVIFDTGGLRSELPAAAYRRAHELFAALPIRPRQTEPLSGPKNLSHNRNP